MHIYYNLALQYRTDSFNCRLSSFPQLRYKEQPLWVLHLLQEDGSPADLAGVVSCRAAVDIDLRSDTEVMCRSLNDDIDLSQAANGVIGVKLNANTAEFLNKADGRENLNGRFELWGYDSDSTVVLYLRFGVLLSAVVDPEGGVPPESVEEDMLVRQSILEALIARKLVIEYSSDGSETHAELRNGDTFYRLRHGPNGDPSEWQNIPYGPGGSAGKAGTVRIGSVTDVGYEDAAEVENSGDENAAVLNFRLRCGRPGKDGQDGQDGLSFVYDASGELSERGVYDDAPQGFIFAAIVNDANERTSTWYFYKKRSDDFGDWHNPLVKIEYSGKDGKNAELIPAVNFTSPPAGVSDDDRCLCFALTDHPAAWIASVVIDTPDGELQLPYFHDCGIRNIYKKDGVFYVYWGSNVPAFETGRIYFAQGLTTLDTAAGGSTAVSGNMVFGYIASDTMTSVVQISAEDLKESTLTTASAEALGKISLGNVPSGTFTVVLLPAGLTAYKDDGLGGKTAFEVDNGVIGSGANGTLITLDGVEYNVYGEFNLVGGETFIYIEEYND